MWGDKRGRVRALSKLIFSHRHRDHSLEGVAAVHLMTLNHPRSFLPMIHTAAWIWQIGFRRLVVVRSERRLLLEVAHFGHETGEGRLAQLLMPQVFLELNEPFLLDHVEIIAGLRRRDRGRVQRHDGR